jgi:uncharacterized protein YqeY
MELTLKERINADYMTAFRARGATVRDTLAKNLLSVIKGEIQTIEKNDKIDNMSDEDVMKILKKTVKNLKETSVNFPSAQIDEELSIIESYIPTQMSEGEIKVAVDEIITSMKTTLTIKEMGKVMGQFNSKYTGLADGKLVSQVVKDALTEKA